MGHGNLDFTSVIEAVPGRTVPSQLKMAALAMIAIGVGAAGFGFATNPERFYSSFVFNFLYFMGISQGGFMLVVAMTLTRARWGKPLKRFCEALLLFAPILYLMFIVVFLIGGFSIYEWAEWHGPNGPEHIPAHKEIYLTKPFFMARMLGGMGILQVLSLLFVRSSLRADLGVAAEQLGDRAPGWWKSLIGNWKGAKEEAEAQINFQMNIAPWIVLAYALTFSLIAIDVSMSLAPYWFANMYPAWYFMSCFWSGLVYVGIISILSKNWLGIGNFLKSNIYHDLGKLTFGFCMFWGYTTFAQFLAIWYGNMEEEIGFILIRSSVEPWATLSRVVVMLCFLVPWVMLLSRSLKKIPPAYLSVTGIIAVGLWLERYAQVYPSVHTGAESLPLGIIEIGMGLGLLGGLLLVVFSYLAKVPAVPVNDPFMHPHPDEVHVLPSSQAHAH